MKRSEDAINEACVAGGIFMRGVLSWRDSRKGFYFSELRPENITSLPR